MKLGIIGYGSMGKMLLWKFSENDHAARADLYVNNRTIDKCEDAAGITEEGTKVVYEDFPKTADLLFERTLEKRRETAQKNK